MNEDIQTLIERIDSLEKRVKKLELKAELADLENEDNDNNQDAPFGEKSSIRISSVPDEKPKQTENVVKCPKCGSTSIITTNKKLSVKRAVVGAAINPIGAAVGAVTSKKMFNVCQNCGYKWKLK